MYYIKATSSELGTVRVTCEESGGQAGPPEADATNGLKPEEADTPYRKSKPRPCRGTAEIDESNVISMSKRANPALEITIRSRGARMQGRVVDKDGLPAAGVGLWRCRTSRAER